MNNLSPAQKREIKNRRSVRKTLTIDGDVADAIENLLKEGHSKEKVIVNDLLRKGLTLVNRNDRLPLFKPFAFKAKLRKGVTLEDLERLLDEI